MADRLRAQGCTPCRRCADLLIAAVALADGLPVVTRDAADFAGLENLIDITET